MMEEALPSFLASVYGWITPPVLFLLLNLVIGTIAVVSKSSHHHQHVGGAYPCRFLPRSLSRSLSRSPSIVLDRLRSFSFRRYCPVEFPYPFEAGAAPVTEITDEISPPSEAAPVPVTEIDDAAPLPAPEAEDEHQQHEHLGRSQSDAQPTAGEMPPKLAVRMKKSASEKSVFAHFKEADIEEAVAEGEGVGGGEVDAAADDFINRFRQQLMLQRLESILRYKEMLSRGC